MEMLDSTEEPPFADDPQGSSGVRISNDTPRQGRVPYVPVVLGAGSQHARPSGQLGANPIALFASLAGHSTTRHTEKYVHIIDELKQKAVDSLPDIIVNYK